jgi:hypothetical protein
VENICEGEKNKEGHLKEKGSNTTNEVNLKIKRYNSCRRGNYKVKKM